MEIKYYLLTYLLILTLYSYMGGVNNTNLNPLVVPGGWLTLHCIMLYIRYVLYDCFLFYSYNGLMLVA